MSSRGPAQLLRRRGAEGAGTRQGSENPPEIKPEQGGTQECLPRRACLIEAMRGMNNNDLCHFQGNRFLVRSHFTLHHWSASYQPPAQVVVGVQLEGCSPLKTSTDEVRVNGVMVLRPAQACPAPLI